MITRPLRLWLLPTCIGLIFASISDVAYFSYEYYSLTKYDDMELWWNRMYYANNTTSNNSSSVDVHPWLVSSQSSPVSLLASTTTRRGAAGGCNDTQYLWFKNRTDVNERCFPFPTVDICRAAPPGGGPEGWHGNLVLEKIRPTITTADNNLSSDTNVTGSPRRKKHIPRILCLVYTHEQNHDLVRTIVHTWGKRCDGFLAMSNVEDKTIGAINLQHSGEEAYGNMWQKTRSILRYAHDNYLEAFDFFHVCGDDVYMVLENMRAYLGSDELLELGRPENMTTTTPTSFQQLRPLLLGAPMFWRNRSFYACAGGSGYTLNQAALRLYASDIHEHCHVNTTSAQEDILISRCFWELGVRCSGWNVHERNTRYHGMDADDRGSRAGDPLRQRRLRRAFGIDIAAGIDGASPQSFAFHMKSVRFRRPPKRLKMMMIQRYEALLYARCLE